MALDGWDCMRIAKQLMDDKVPIIRVKSLSLIHILSSKDAKKVYTNCTAAVLRAKECVMKTVSTVQENAEDIYADAKAINEERAAAEEAAEFDSLDDVTEETLHETLNETEAAAE